MKLPIKNIAVGTSHAKIILIGEHAVVYGKPAVSLPLPILKIHSIITSTTGPITIKSDYYEGDIDQVPEKFWGIRECVFETLTGLGCPKTGLHIEIRSAIPIGRGLGSSAAVACSIVRGIYKFFDKELKEETLKRLIHIAETYAHGNPSGIDGISVTANHPIWFIKGKDPEPVSIHTPFFMVVADTGRFGDTRSAVLSIKEKMESDSESVYQSLDLLEKYTYQAKDSLINGRIPVLGQLMNSAQEELDKLGISDEGINHFVRIALENDALGSKLTGGGRGGCTISLVKDEGGAKKIAHALEKAGAANTWIVQYGQ